MIVSNESIEIAETESGDQTELEVSENESGNHAESGEIVLADTQLDQTDADNVQVGLLYPLKHIYICM